MSSSPNQFALLRERRFLPFFVTQFLGAFNDNVYKNALVILITFEAARLTTLDAGLLVNACAGIFILPFFLFSATSGQLADRFEKTRLIRAIKLLEIGVMVLALVGFVRMDLNILLGALFLMGLHSTLFGPVKYAILPQTLDDDELVGGNALVESGTFVAILLGTILGGLLIAAPSGTLLAPAVAIVVAVLGYLASRGIPPAPAADPGLRIDWNPLTQTWRTIGFTRENRTVFLAILGISWFWFYGALFLSQFPAYAKDYLGGGETAVTLLLATFSVGIGVGSLLCERLSGRHIELGLVPFGSIGLTLFAADLWWTSPPPATSFHVGFAAFVGDPSHWHVLADLLGIGVFGGFYIVPLYALMQSRSDPAKRSRIIAGNNILNALFMVVAALLAIGLLAAGLSIPQLFLFTAVANAAVAVYIYTLVPEFLLRFVVWLLIHSVYRLRETGHEHLPDDGPAVLVCNHVSFVDALIIAAASRRPVRFVMDAAIFRMPVLSFVFRTAKAIPIASAKEDPVLVERAFEAVAAALAEGELVCVFPEGKITSTGEMNPFRPGIGRILARTPVPVVPMALSGLWGSFFSRDGGAAMTRWHRAIPFRRIALTIGPALPPAEATPERLQAEVAALRGGWR